MPESGFDQVRMLNAEQLRKRKGKGKQERKRGKKLFRLAFMIGAKSLYGL